MGKPKTVQRGCWLCNHKGCWWCTETEDDGYMEDCGRFFPGETPDDPITGFLKWLWG